jgi:2OG-Fe(II) oxygenase superfamily
MQIIEIPNAIPKTYQDMVESELGSPQMLWTYQEEAARRGAGFATSFGGFSHIAYLTADDEPSVSPLSSLLLPILFVFCEKAKLEFRALLRIRIGLFTPMPGGAAHHNPHVDFSQPHQTAVYYVNDSDGDTVIFSETIDEVSVERSTEFANQNLFTVAGSVPPKKGKMCCFDGRYYHASSSPTRAAKRIAITFNFV